MRVTLTFVVLQHMVFGIGRAVCWVRGHDWRYAEIRGDNGSILASGWHCLRCQLVENHITEAGREALAAHRS